MIVESEHALLTAWRDDLLKFQKPIPSRLKVLKRIEDAIASRVEVLASREFKLFKIRQSKAVLKKWR